MRDARPLREREAGVGLCELAPLREVHDEHARHPDVSLKSERSPTSNGLA